MINRKTIRALDFESDRIVSNEVEELFRQGVEDVEVSESCPIVYSDKLYYITTITWESPK